MLSKCQRKVPILPCMHVHEMKDISVPGKIILYIIGILLCNYCTYEENTWWSSMNSAKNFILKHYTDEKN